MLWYFEIGVNGKIVKCAIYWKRLVVERNGWKFGSRGRRKVMCRVLVVSGHLSSICGHSVRYANFLILTFSKGYCSHSFHPISTKLYGKHGNQGESGGIQVFGDLPNWKKLMVVRIFCQHRTICGSKILKRCSSHSFDPISAKRYEDLCYHGGIQAVTFSWQSAKFYKFCRTLKF